MAESPSPGAPTCIARMQAMLEAYKKEMEGFPDLSFALSETGLCRGISFGDDVIVSCDPEHVERIRQFVSDFRARYPNHPQLKRQRRVDVVVYKPAQLIV